MFVLKSITNFAVFFSPAISISGNGAPAKKFLLSVPFGVAVVIEKSSFCGFCAQILFAPSGYDAIAKVKPIVLNVFVIRILK